MTKEEAIKQLEAMPKDGDEEILHGDADEILLKLLDAMGAPEVVVAYEATRERVGFWYA